MDGNFTRESLPTDAENYIVFCERCQRYHRHHTFTQEDCDRVISEAAKKMADAWDDRLAAEMYRKK